MPVNFFTHEGNLKFHGGKLVFPENYFNATGEYYTLDVGEAAIYDFYAENSRATFDTYIRMVNIYESLYEILVFDLYGNLSGNEVVLYLDNNETNYEFTFVNKVVSYDGSNTTSTQVSMSSLSGIKLLVFPNFITRCLLLFSYTGIRLNGSCEQITDTGGFNFYDFVNFSTSDFSSASGKFGSFSFTAIEYTSFRVIIHRLF